MKNLDPGHVSLTGLCYCQLDSFWFTFMMSRRLVQEVSRTSSLILHDELGVFAPP